MARVELMIDEETVPLQDFDRSLPGIVLLHGMTSSKETWVHLMQPLANATGRKVFTYDARNHGDSGWSDMFDYDSMVIDLEAVLGTLHNPKATLIGHGMGGKVAMKYALKWPERVEMLIIEDISPMPPPPGDMKYVHMFIEILKQSLRVIPPGEKNMDRAKEIITYFIHDKMTPEHRSERHALLPPQELPLKRESGTFQWKANLEAIQYSAEYALPATSYDEGKFEGPTLFLYGTKSVYNRTKEKDYILERFPNALFSSIEGIGHSLHAEQPEEFAKKVVNFMYYS